MRTLVATASLCSLVFLSSCGPSQSTGDCSKNGTCLNNPDSSAPVDVPIAQDAITDLPGGSPDLIPADGNSDRAADRVNVAEGGADGPAPALDGADTGAPVDAGIDASTDDAASDDGPGDADQGDTPVLDGTCAINGRPARAGTVCRVASGPCDVVEYCDGASTACPLDRFLAKDEVCRPMAGACDHEEKCSGTSPACPADTFLAKGATCRATVSDCDLPEYCGGTGADCPVDLFAPATVKCRPSTDDNVCDPPEYCSGKANQCPPDAIYTPPTAAPTGIAVTPGTLLADIAWNAVPGVTGYNVKSSTVSGTGFAIRGSPAASPFTVTSLNATQTFYFVVTAYSGQPSCESPNSSQVSALSCLATAPTGLIAIPDSAGHVVLTWTAPASIVASYSVSRSTTSGTGYTGVPGATGLLTTTFTDSPVVPGGTATFYYVVRANTGTCLSPYSTPAMATIAGARADAGADADINAGADVSVDADIDAGENADAAAD